MGKLMRLLPAVGHADRPEANDRDSQSGERAGFQRDPSYTVTSRTDVVHILDAVWANFSWDFAVDIHSAAKPFRLLMTFDRPAGTLDEANFASRWRNAVLTVDGHERPIADHFDQLDSVLDIDSTRWHDRGLIRVDFALADEGRVANVRLSYDAYLPFANMSVIDGYQIQLPHLTKQVTAVLSAEAFDLAPAARPENGFRVEALTDAVTAEADPDESRLAGRVLTTTDGAIRFALQPDEKVQEYRLWFTAKPKPTVPIGPALAERLADHNWFEEQYAAGAFDQYAGKYIVFSHQTCHVADADPTGLREKAIQKSGVPSHRLMIEFIPGGE